MKILSHRFVFGTILVLAAAIGSFTATWAARSRAASAPSTAPANATSDAMLDWLRVPDNRRADLQQRDESFPADLAKLRADLAAARSALAAALDSPATSDAEIRTRSEAVIAASAALERRVTDHLLRIRPQLSTEQQRQLFGLCAEGVRQGRGWQWRHGQGGGGPGMGRGMGMGRGAGRGGPPSSRRS